MRKGRQLRHRAGTGKPIGGSPGRPVTCRVHRQQGDLTRQLPLEPAAVRQVPIPPRIMELARITGGQNMYTPYALCRSSLRTRIACNSC